MWLENLKKADCLEELVGGCRVILKRILNM